MTLKMDPSDGLVRVVGSIGSTDALATTTSAAAAMACDIVELRLDLLWQTEAASPNWRHLRGIPLLMTARAQEEGGAPGIEPSARFDMLHRAFDDASIIDIEVASIPQASDLLVRLRDAGIPWVASFHDFNRTPDDAQLIEAAIAASEAGASVFKVAAMIREPRDLAQLADFQRQQPRLGITLATMGMGPLAAVSRLLCAQYGSALNYGHLGGAPTAPGQWDSATLRQAIRQLPPPHP